MKDFPAVNIVRLDVPTKLELQTTENVDDAVKFLTRHKKNIVLENAYKIPSFIVSVDAVRH